jgi:plasmid stabilization system protein ParE
MLLRIQNALQRIALFPGTGQPTRMLNVREVIVAPYIVQYRIGRERIEVLRVRYGRQGFASKA